MTQPTWSGRRVTNALNQLKKAGYKANAPCCICEQPIDYNLSSDDPDGCTIQHLKPRSTHPHLIWEPTNWAPAHRQCNIQASDNQTLDIGMTSRSWG